MVEKNPMSKENEDNELAKASSRDIIVEALHKIDDTHKRSRSAKSYYAEPHPPATPLPAQQDKPSGEKKTTATPKNTFKVVSKNNGKHLDQIDSRDLPAHYNKTSVTLLAKDPYRLYAYWEITADGINRVKQQKGHDFEKGVYTLRVYDVTLIDFNGINANYWFDLDELFMQGRDINVWNDQATYCVEIGLRFPDGSFSSMARSNFITTPRAHVSGRYDLIWKEVYDNEPSQVFVNINFLNRSLRGALKSRVNWQQNGRRLTLSPDQVKVYYQLKKGLSRQLMPFKGEAGSLSQFDANDLALQFEKSIIPELMTGEYAYNKKQVASEEFLGKGNKEKDFYFDLNMVLTVHGKTEPGAQCRLGNKKIDVSSDGTFTLKWNLKDGVLPLSFEAKSPAKGMRKVISTNVIRTKTQKSE